ncbi:Uncharacterised protein [uncultured archaeon]|nr:Uncharacterised protein [uncultured archaeon]
METKINLKISKELKNKLEKKIKKTNFNSIEEYINYLLEQVLSDDEDFGEAIYSEKEEKDIHGDNTYSEEEEESLKKNLKDLGYL